MPLCSEIFSRNNLFSLLYIITVVPTFWAGTSTDSTLGTESLKNLISYISYVMLFITTLFGVINKIFVIDKYIIIGIFGILSYWCFYYFSAINNVPLGLLNISFLILFLVASHEIKYKIYCYIKVLIIFTSILGILFYLSTAMMIDIGQTIYPYYSSETGTRLYIVLGPLNIFVEGLFIRLCGCFNEPGYWGTVLALVLTVEGYKFNRANIVLFIAGVCSWSLTFFLITAVNILHRYHNKIWRLSLVIITTVILMGVVLADNPNMEHLMNRIAFDNQGNFVGNNRSNKDIDKGFIDTLTSEYFLLGHGTGYAHTLTNLPFATFKSLIIEYGFLGTTFMYSGVFILAVIESKKNYNALWLICMFILSLCQRPIIFLSIYFIILYGGIQYILKKNII